MGSFFCLSAFTDIIKSTDDETQFSLVGEELKINFYAASELERNNWTRAVASAMGIELEEKSDDGLAV